MPGSFFCLGKKYRKLVGKYEGETNLRGGDNRVNDRIKIQTSLERQKPRWDWTGMNARPSTSRSSF